MPFFFSWRSSAKGRFHFLTGCVALILTKVELFHRQPLTFLAKLILYSFLGVASKQDKSVSLRCALFTLCFIQQPL